MGDLWVFIRGPGILEGDLKDVVQ